MRPTRLLLPLLAVSASLGVAGCGSSTSSSTSSSTAATAASCTKSRLALVNSGTLTVGTDKPGYPPYIVDDKPSNGKGFESAVSYAIAKQLGFTPSQVKWIVVPFNSSYAPGEKKFDFDINQISITPKRATAVSFSSPYYTAPQAVLALKGSKVANATSLADLKDAKLGVQVGTTSLSAVQDVIKPSQQPAGQARVQPEVVAQRGHVLRAAADRVEHPGRAQRATAAQERGVERAHFGGDSAVEASDSGNGIEGHCLTLFR